MYLICNPILVETTNNPLMQKAKTPALYFLGITEINGTSILNEVEENLRTIFLNLTTAVNFSKKDELLILALTDPAFRYYIVVTSEDKFSDYRMLAKDFELPWDEKPTDKDKLERIYVEIKKKKWFDFDPYPEVGFTILEELSLVSSIRIYAIPSFVK